MGSFHYKAVDVTGALQSGTLVADNAEDARARLRQAQLFPERVVPAQRAATRLLERLPGRRFRAGLHVTVFTRQCAVLLGSGVPIVEALDVLARQTEHRGLSLALAEIHDAVSSGRSFAGALAEYPQFFDRSYVGMVASGEKSGTMDVVFARLADFLERRGMVQSRVSTALIYPSILVVMVAALLVFLSGYVVPMIRPLLEQRHRPLPLTTWLLFRVGDFVRGYGWIAALVLAAAAAALVWAWRRPAGREALDALILRAPLFGRIVLKGIISRFTMTFATLLRAGVPAAEALQVLAGMAPNAAFVREITQVREAVIEGKDISTRLSNSKLFPPMVGYMVSVGERSGNLAEVLEHVSNAYELEVEVASRRMLAVLEPALILVMASVVGFIAMSLMTTVLELSHI